MHAHRQVHFNVNMTQRSYADHGYAWVILGGSYILIYIYIIINLSDSTNIDYLCALSFVRTFAFN